MHRLLILGSTALLTLSAFGCSSEEASPRRDVGGDGTNGSNGASSVTGATNVANANSAVGSATSTTGGIVDVNDNVTPEDDCGAALPVTLRDFKGSGESGGHIDFEISARNIYAEGATEPYKGWNDVGCGLVEPTLGADSKPVFYAGAADANDGLSIPVGAGRQQRKVAGPGCWTESNPTPTGICNIGTCQKWEFAPPTSEIQSASTFNQWYNTIAGVNMEVQMELPLADDGTGSGNRVYDSTAFFPLDGQGFGNTPGQTHNYHFTTEAHVLFTYQMGQVFTFRGDDDLWIFVNGKLALDVGGLHQALEGTIAFDAKAAELGITPGMQYQMDIFHAERQTTESNFRIETNITCFVPVDIVK